MRSVGSVILLTVATMLPLTANAQLFNTTSKTKRVLHQPVQRKTHSAKPTSNTKPIVKHPASEHPVSEHPVSEHPVSQASYSEPLILNDAITGSCQPTCASPVAWISAEYLFWSTKGVEIPALVTTSPAGTPQTAAGILPGATTLFGGDRIHEEGRSGGRYSLGGWIDHAKSFEVSYLELNDVSERFSASTRDTPILGRPFRNTLADIENARLVSFDGLVEGDISIRSSTEFQTYEFLLRHAIMRASGAKIGFSIGYRGANLEDILRIEESTTALSGLVAGSSFDLRDEFDTENEFHGVTLGYEYIGPMIRNGTLELFGKVALGATSARAAVNGRTDVVTASGDTSIAIAGLLTQGTNIGTYKDIDFDTLSELGIRMRYQTCHGLDFFVGYSFMFWGQVARAGGQIDRGINVTQVPPGTLVGDRRPRRPIDRETFWAQGLNLGFSYDF